MTTTYTPVDRDFLCTLALAKARGMSWTLIAEKTNWTVLDLEIIPWREPQAWAKACRYAEKLVAADVLAETMATLRAEVKNPATNARLKTQLSNSIVRVIQMQHSFRTPKRPVAKASPRPTPHAIPIVPPPTNESVVPPAHTSPPSTPSKPTSTTPLATVAAILLFVLFGAFAVWRSGSLIMHDATTLTINSSDDRAIVAYVAHQPDQVPTRSNMQKALVFPAPSTIRVGGQQRPLLDMGATPEASSRNAKRYGEQPIARSTKSAHLLDFKREIAYFKGVEYGSFPVFG